MKATKVKQVMVPLSDYATISEEDTLADALRVLNHAQTDTKYRLKHRAVLALNAENKVTGKLSFRDILKALEPKYRQFENPENVSGIGLSRFGLNEDFLNSLLDNFNLWDESIEELVQKASKSIVKDVMYTPGQGEYVSADAPLAEAVHQFILGCHQALLVVEDKEVVGIIRLADLIELVCNAIE